MKLSQNLRIVTPLLIICTPSITKKRKFTTQTDNVSKKRKLMSDDFEQPATKVKINCTLPKNIVANSLIIMVIVILEFDVLFYKCTMTNVTYIM